MPWKTILENLIPLLVTIVTPVLLALVHQLLSAIAKKYQMDALLVYEEKIKELVEQGILAAEKSVLNALKANGTKATSEEKLQSVVEYVNARLKELKLPEKSVPQLSKLIEARLMTMQLGQDKK